ncbi:MAG: hypothetical protein WCG27_06270 [Pseudomonadota bacterium]
MILSKSKLDIKILCLTFSGTLLLRAPFWIFYFGIPRVQKSNLIHDWKMMCRWDCSDYFFLLAQKYTPSAFFPLFPLSAGFLHTLFPNLDVQLCLLITSWFFSFLFGVVFLYALDLFYPPDKTKIWGHNPLSWIIALLLSIYPHGHFFLEGYSESLFAFLFALALLLFRKNIWMAALCFGLMAVTRAQGIWVLSIYIVCLIYSAYQELPKNKSTKLCYTHVLPMIISIIPLLVFMGWLWNQTGDPLYFLHAQSSPQWGRHFQFLKGILNFLPRYDRAVFFLYFSCWAGYVLLRRKDILFKILGGSSLMMAIIPIFFGGFFSYDRFVATNLAFFFILGELCQKNKILLWIITLLFIPAFGVQIFYYASGRFAG